MEALKTLFIAISFLSCLCMQQLENPTFRARDHPELHLTPCQNQLVPHLMYMAGPYPIAIASAFPDLNGQPFVFASGDNQNLHCRCIQTTIMICEIRLPQGSETLEAAYARLDLPNIEPFFHWGTDENPIKGFQMPGIIPPVLAQIHIIPIENEGANTNGDSSSGVTQSTDASSSSGVAQTSGASSSGMAQSSANQLPTNANGAASSSGAAQSSGTQSLLTIPMNLCDGVDSDRPSCPVMMQAFRPGDVVYVLRGALGTEELSRVPPRSVVCISTRGLAQSAANNPDQDGRFLDPLRRREERLSVDDYDRRVITLTPAMLIPMDLCDGVGRPSCLITMQEFEEGDIVFVLRGHGGTDDLSRVPPRVVACFSRRGLISIAVANANWSGLFPDPLRRRPGRLGLDDYERRIITYTSSNNGQASSSESRPDHVVNLRDEIARIIANNRANLPRIPLNVCKALDDSGDRPACPVLFIEYKDGDIVYILKGPEGTDDLTRTPPVQVYCISAEALEELSSTFAGRFFDPLRRRTGNPRLTLLDFQKSVIIDNSTSSEERSASGTHADNSADALSAGLSGLNFESREVAAIMTNINFHGFLSFTIFFSFFTFAIFYNFDYFIHLFCKETIHMNFEPFLSEDTDVDV